MKRAVAICGMLLIATAAEPCSMVTIPKKVSRSLAITVKRDASPVPATDVVVVDASARKPREVAHAKTDVTCVAVIRDLPPGTYSVRPSHQPTLEWGVVIEVEDRSGTTPIDIKLRSEPPLPAPVRMKRLNGVVSDSVGAVIANAKVVVQLHDPGHAEIAIGKTNEAGQISFPLSAGSYVVRVSQQGFSTAVIAIDVANDEDAWPAFRLRMQPQPCLGEQPFHYRIERESAAK